MAALTLGARASILLVDRQTPSRAGSTPKLCGGLLTSVAQRLLPQPPPEEIRASPWRTRLEFHDLNRRRIWAYDVDYANCHRGKLDRWLLDEALAACGEPTFEQGARVVGLRVHDSSWMVRLLHHPGGQQEEVRARFVIDATGWRQVSRRLLGIALAPRLNAFQATGAVRGNPHGNFIAVFDSRQTPFYCWWIPKGETAELGAAFPPEKRRRSGAEFLAPFSAYLARRGIEFEEVAEIRGCPLTYISRRDHIWTGRGGLLVAGEAAGLVSPSSGDGISYALASGKASAETILSAVSGRVRKTTIETTTGCDARPATAGEDSLQTEYRRRLRPHLKELHFNIRKARWLAHPRARGRLSWLLALARNRHPRRLPFL